MNMKTLFSLLLFAGGILLPAATTAQNPGGFVVVGDTSAMVSDSSGWLPCHLFDAGCSQQIVLNGEMGGESLVTGIDFYCCRPDSTARTGCTVFLANTFVPSLDSTNRWGGMVPFGVAFERVFVGSLACTAGWNHLDFDTVFHYTGFGNLIVAVDCAAGTGGGTFCCEYSTDKVSRYSGSRMEDITPFTQTSATPYRNVMRLHTRPVPAAAACPAPVPRFDAVGATSMRLVWSPGGQDTAWLVQLCTDGDSDWMSGGLVTGDSSCVLTGLNPNTHYIVRLTAFCPDTNSTVLKHLLTSCTPLPLPLFEDFEDGIDDFDCWFTTTGAWGDRPTVTTLPSLSGLHSLRLNGGTVVLPPFDASPDSLEVSFSVKNGHCPNSVNLYLGVVADPLDISTFVPVGIIALPLNTGWASVSVSTSSFDGSSGRLAIQSQYSDMPYIFIDDLEVYPIVSCSTVSTVNVESVSSFSATVRWEDSASSQYEVAFGLSGFTIADSNIVSVWDADSVLLTGLLPDTVYDVYVRLLCGNHFTRWSQVLSFRTLCSPIDTLPYTQDFELVGSATQPTDIPCWKGVSSHYTNITNYSGEAHSGSHAIVMISRYNNTSFSRIVLPPVDETVYPVNTLRVSFWARNYNPYGVGGGRVVVGVMTDPDEESTFYPVDTVDIVDEGWVSHEVPLSPYPGTHGFIALLESPVAGVMVTYCYVDDITISVLPPCHEVTGFAIKGLTDASVSVGWDDPGDGTEWQTVIATSPQTPHEGGTVLLDSAGFSFGGLTTGVVYYLWVRAVCPSGDTSDWTGPIQYVAGLWNMGVNSHDTLGMCSVSLYDDGGLNGGFSYQNSSLVVLPYSPGYLVSIGGRSDIGYFSTLTVYDGVGTAGPVLWTSGTYSAAGNFGPVVSDSGPLTLVFNGVPGYPVTDGFSLQVGCVPDSCRVRHLRLDPSVPLSDSVLSLTWDCNGASLYEVEYGPVGFTLGTGTFDTTSSNNYAITGLPSLSRREVHVRCICGPDAGSMSEADTSAWESGIFTTQPCGDAVSRDNSSSAAGLTTSSMFPIGPNDSPYSYTQTIIDSAHLSGLEGGITALAFQPYGDAGADHMKNVTVYLANVSDASLTGGPVQPDAAHRFVKVIDSADFCHEATSDWQIFSFDRPFMWDGHQNLLVAVLREDGGSGARTNYSAHYGTGSVSSAYLIMGNNPIDIERARTYTSPAYNCYASSIVGDLLLYSNTCDMPLCAEPVVDSVSGDYESVTLFWHGMGDNTQLTIAPITAGTDTVLSGNSSYTFTGLRPATSYWVSLRQDCNADSLGFSDWVTIQFTTDSFLCPAPDSLRVYDITRNSATFDWAAGSDSLWQFEIWTQGNRHVSYSVSEHPFTVDNLDAGNEYFARLHGYCGSEGQIAGAWSDTLFFATPFCPNVTGLDTASVTTTSVTLVWDAVQESPVADQNYLLEYGSAGFTLGSGTEQPVVGTTCTVAGLTPATAYDFYLRAVCADDWYSTQYASLLNVVTRMPVDIAHVDSGAFTATIVPNPAKGVTTLYLEELPKQYRGAVEVTVADLTGREVLQRSVDCSGSCSLSLDVTTLPAGAYFVRIRCGGDKAVRKLLVK